MRRHQALGGPTPRGKHVELEALDVHLVQVHVLHPNQLHGLAQRNKVFVLRRLLHTAEAEVEELVALGVEDLALNRHGAVKRIHVAGRVAQHRLLELVLVVGAQRKNMAW
jgi:hypothetical protein